MILSDIDIKKALEEEQISVKPLFPNAIQPASIDLHLDKYFLIFDTSYHHVIDTQKPVDDLMREIEINEHRAFILHPGEFALGSTFEEIGVADDMVGRLEGKSSLGRIGIIIHATAGYLDPGNKLHMTLELHNIGTLPVKLYYKMPIAQMSFSPLSSKAEKPYGIKENSKYFGASRPQASAMFKNFSPTPSVNLFGKTSGVEEDPSAGGDGSTPDVEEKRLSKSGNTKQQNATPNPFTAPTPPPGSSENDPTSVADILKKRVEAETTSEEKPEIRSSLTPPTL